MRDFPSLEQRVCPWCGRTLFAFNDDLECWECGVRWTRHIMRTWKPVDGDDALLHDAVVDVPKGSLVVRRERVSNV